MMTEKEEKEPCEEFTPEELRHLKVAISLALTDPLDIDEMPKTKEALHELYHKIERMQGGEEQCANFE
jgi:hypothetical protein